MIVQFRNEKVSNHGSIPITIDCNVVAFIVFEEGFHQPIKHTKHCISLSAKQLRSWDCEWERKYRRSQKFELHRYIAKLIEASDGEEVSEYENHTSDEIESESSDNNFDTNNQKMNYKESFQSNNREIVEVKSAGTFFSINNS
ncbi:hypothetical protein TNCV_2473771 [Trichonephila clavipes]|nr:hypothetical protein TNCV_2473771 [Trichonephila clavipes]